MRLLPVACAALAASALTFAAGAALACSCAPPPPAPAAKAAAAHVFEAKVTAGPTAPAPGPDGAMSSFAPVSYSMEVLRSWKGGLSGDVSVFTAGNGAACGRSFEVGTTYLIYASVADDGKLRDGLCSRTRSGEPAKEDISVLGAPEAPGGETKPVDGGTETTAQEGDAQAGTETDPAAGSETRPAGAQGDSSTNGGSTAPPADEDETTSTGKDPADPSCSVGAAPGASSLVALALLGLLPARRRR